MNKVLYWFLYSCAINPLVCKRNNMVVDAEEIKDIKPPFVAICNHPGFFDWAYAAKALRPHYVSFMTAKYYFFNPVLGFLLNRLGAIPKQLFSPDVSTIKQCIRVVKDGGVLCFFPEGRLSAYGEIETVSDGTFALLKKLGVPVVNIHIDGSYRSTPKFNMSLRRGEIRVKASVLFTKADLETLSMEEGKRLVFDALYYNEFHESNIRSFLSKTIAEGLENILYICPKCKSEFTLMTKGNSICCSECNNSFILDEYYRFHKANEDCVGFNDIREWYLFQKETERNRVQDPDFEMKCHVILKQPVKKTEMFSYVGEGNAQISREGFSYIGKKNGEDFSLSVPLDSLPALLFGANENFEVYRGNDFYYFVPDNPLHVVKWSVVYGELYNSFSSR